MMQKNFPFHKENILYMDDRIYCCEDCMHCRYDSDSNKYYCRRSYTDVDPEDFVCDDFEEAD